MQDNEYTDTQVGDAGGLFKSLEPALCGAVPASSSAPVPVFLIQCSGSSLPHPVLQIQSTSSSAAVPVYFIQCPSSILPHPVLQLQSTSSTEYSSPEDFNYYYYFILIIIIILFLESFFFFLHLTPFFKCNNVLYTFSYFIYYTLFILYNIHYYCHSDFLCFRLNYITHSTNHRIQ